MVINLPEPDKDKLFSLDKAFKLRESKRKYLDNPISLKHLSKLLHAAQGFRGNDNKLTAPSAQEQYPLATYIIANNVTDTNEGLYQYINSDHSIKLINMGSFSDALKEAAIGEQAWIAKATMIIVLASHIQHMNQHFSSQPPLNQRGERYCYIEVGAVSQNIQLQATALDIGMVLVGGFDNKRVKSILNLPMQLEPAALLCLGNV